MNLKRYLLLLILLMFLVFGISLPSHAEEQPVRDSSISMAVFRIQANNCPQALGSAVEELAIAKLYASSLFILSEKTQMDRIARRNGFDEFDLTDNLMVSKLGKLLNVRKMVVGSVNKVGNYKLELRSINTADAAVDISIHTEADAERDIEKAVTKAVQAIERHYQGYGKISGAFNITLSAASFTPFGLLKSNGARSSYGTSLSFSFNNVCFDDIFAAPTISWYKATTTSEEIRSLSMILGQTFIGYRFNPTKTFSIAPSLGAGVLTSFTNHSRDGITYNGHYQYHRDSYYNFICTAKIETSFLIYDRWKMSAAPFFIFMPDRGGNSFFPGAEIGLTLIF